MENIILHVDGMSCGHCEAAVQDAVSKLAGIKKVRASKRKKEVCVAFDRSQTATDAIIAAIKDAGYEVVV